MNFHFIDLLYSQGVAKKNVREPGVTGFLVFWSQYFEENQLSYPLGVNCLTEAKTAWKALKESAKNE